MKPADHSGELEQVMAYVDGALDRESAELVRRHIVGCHQCRQAEADLREVSDRLQAWDVDAVPVSLRPPVVAEKAPVSTPSLFGLGITPRRFLAAAAGLALVVLAGEMLTQEKRDKRPQLLAAEESRVAAVASGTALVAGKPPSDKELAQEGVAGSPQGLVNKGPLIARNARFTIVANDFDSARAELERAVQQVGGFIGQIVVRGTRGESRQLDATLRVPTARLEEAVAALRRLGQVVGESQDGEDVTQQSADLDTRLENARVSEKRLRDILAQRTGKLSDVLDVEREIARVRGEIEGMEAERRSLDRRVTYATVSVTLTEDRKSEVNLGPVPVSRRLRNALVEGWTNAINSGVDVLLFIAGVGPTLVLWAMILVPAAVLVRRRLSRAG